ncbi:MAG: hypothetical protein KBS72_03455 [Bacteroidales bacterium]|nr:hypothetical protein [Candidatus Cacconaster scatequi]
MKSPLMRKLTLTCASVFLTLSAYAQKDVTSMLSTTQSTLKTIVTPIINIFSIILGLIGVVMLAPDMAKFMKGEGTSADSLLKHGGGLLIAVILLQIIRVTLLS